MTHARFPAVFFVGVLTTVAAWQVVEGKDKATASDTEKLASAALRCDVPKLKELIAAGANVSAMDDQGLDALSHACLNRSTKGVNTWGMLKCPAAVVALTEAGADPGKASFYQSPSLDEDRPEMIAVISVQDDRKDKGESDKLRQRMSDAIEGYLQARHGPGLKYPILRLSEVRQKLLASGFSPEDTIAPDRAKACKVLGADSVLEASMEDYRSRNIGIASAAGIRFRFVLTKCKTGELLFRSDRDYTLTEGWLLALSGNKVQQIITSPTGPLAFPCYQKKK